MIPASGPVSKRSSPIIRLIRVDFPALGRPTTAIRSERSLLPGSGPAPTRDPRAAIPPASPSDRGVSRECRLSRPIPCSAEILTGSPKPSPYASNTPASAAGLSALFAARTTVAEWRRNMSASSRSPASIPARASTRNRHRSAIRTARSVNRRIRPSRDSSVAVSSPAVSSTVNRRSPIRASPSRRSRVTPGRSSTSANRLPTRRLNNVDFPTLVRPTMATVNDMDTVRLNWAPTRTHYLSIGRRGADHGRKRYTWFRPRKPWNSPRLQAIRMC